MLQQAAGERVAQVQGLQALAYEEQRSDLGTCLRTRPTKLVSELRDGLAARDERISTLEDTSDLQAALIAELQGKLTAKRWVVHQFERKTAGLEKAMRKVSETIEEKKRLLGERDAMIDAMAKQIEDRDQRAKLAHLRRAELTTQRIRAVAQLNVAEKTPPGFAAGLLARKGSKEDAAQALGPPPRSLLWHVACPEGACEHPAAGNGNYHQSVV